ncbi:hypothetical protein RJ55_07412 [Drechmeria coniospora]|nr:hypothetical protein RJ55_07412 [Drechmeria coniospora]
MSRLENATAVESPGRWRERFLDPLCHMFDFVTLAAICLASELVIWGLSRALAPARLEFLASVLGMVLVFSAAVLAGWIFPCFDALYQQTIMSKVDLINANLGVGFTIPIVMMDGRKHLSSHEVACVIGTFVLTNVVSWTAVFLLSVFVLAVVGRLKSRLVRSVTLCAIGRRPSRTRRDEAQSCSQAAIPYGLRFCRGSDCSSSSLSPSWSASVHDTVSPAPETRRHRLRKSWLARFLLANCTILLSLAGFLAIGLPLAAVAEDDRFLDGFAILFVWISAVRLQRSFKSSSLLATTMRTKGVLTTAMNPVLATSLLLVAYTRAKAAVQGDGLEHVLDTLSGGTPLYALWTAKVTDEPVSGHRSAWFGAGDAALSVLECGMLTWGFKLYECRRQVFSGAGIVTIVLCTATATGNVFLSVLAAHSIGLAPAEVLAFAARSTTLALAKPAMSATGGNMAINALLVVGNGILGQLMYPIALDRLGVRESPSCEMGDGSSGSGTSVALGRPAPSVRNKMEGLTVENDGEDDDDPVTTAAGVTIGINGAAMGVSYLYETSSHAAPYAALSMTVFGVLTVVLTTVEPFRNLVLRLSER